ncbi:hypothetical protein CALVIDRAFT_202911 [Calocera viscosa TUFC12733]|uniref:F-box domain-containing protein n=1 Tax=Calocera viscosa (strain TUFC12733) TaxID=1330018 RepID=A0A167KBH9_CALVF|nr:hypothetical protein CALVIDRAFT_202911 [Calocera viscosa TUFC12733]
MRNNALSVELWYMVFEFVAAVPAGNRARRRRHPLLPLLLVCKGWKEIAAPLLFRRITISRSRALSLFAQNLPRRHLPAGPAANYIRHFTIHLTLEDASDFSDLMSILSQTQNLVSLTGLEGSFRELTVLAASCAKTLRSLDFSLAEGERLSDALHALKEFTSLRRLSFDAQEHAEPSEDVTEIPLLVAPELQYLSLTPPMGDDRTETLAYFSRCRFPSLTELHLGFLTEKAVSTLYDFLCYHGPQLERIGFGDFNSTLIPKNLLPHVQHIVFEANEWDNYDWPPAAWFPHFPPSASHVHLDTVSEDLPEQYSSFFEEVLQNRATVHVKFLHFDDPFFSWDRLYRDHPEYAGHWVKIALELKEQAGITVLDKDGFMWTRAPPE